MLVHLSVFYCPTLWSNKNQKCWANTQPASIWFIVSGLWTQRGQLGVVILSCQVYQVSNICCEPPATLKKMTFVWSPWSPNSFAGTKKDGLACCCSIFQIHNCAIVLFRHHTCFFSIRVIVELAIPCVKSGPRIFKGFTVGFHPRSSEIVSSSRFVC